MEGNAGEHSAKLEISNGIVQLMSNHYGRGPNKAKTIVVDQYVLVVLEDLLTRAETTMVRGVRWRSRNQEAALPPSLPCKVCPAASPTSPSSRTRVGPVHATEFRPRKPGRPRV